MKKPVYLPPEARVFHVELNHIICESSNTGQLPKYLDGTGDNPGWSTDPED